MIQVRSLISEYAGQADAQARRRSDQQVRAWIGERLAELRQRLSLGEVSGPFDELLMHCQFGDQRVIKALEDNGFADPATSADVETEDARVIDAASASERIDAAGVAAFIDTLAAAFRRRNDAIVALRQGNLDRQQ